MTASTKLGQKRAGERIARHSAAVQWKADGPYFELDGKPTRVQELPTSLPPNKETVDTDGYVSRLGVVVVIPSPWVGTGRNRAAARYWRSLGFVLRDATNCDGLICTDLREWVRPVGQLKGRRFSVTAWAVWADKKYKEHYA